MSFTDKKGITVASGFKLQAEAPIDARFVCDTIADRDELVTINAAYAGLSVYVTAEGKEYLYNGSDWEEKGNGGDAGTVNGHTVESDVPANAVFTDTTYEEATTSKAGLLSAADKAKLAGIAANATTLEGYGITDAYTKTEADDAISAAVKSAVTGVYKIKGSIAFASLPTSGMSEGDVYNITDDFTTTAAFVEGAGQEYKAGTNVVYTASGWDCMAGTYDFSDFMMKSDIEDITEAEINEICVIPE